jgi:hypothetical protein
MMVSQQMPDLNNPEAVKGFQEELKTKATELQKSMKELNNSEQDLMNSITTCKGKQDEKDERSAKSVIEGLTKSLDSCATMLKLSDAKAFDALGELADSLKNVLAIEYKDISGSENVSDALAGIGISADAQDKRKKCENMKDPKGEFKSGYNQEKWDDAKCDKMDKTDLTQCKSLSANLKKYNYKIVETKEGTSVESIKAQ